MKEISETLQGLYISDTNQISNPSRHVYASACLSCLFIRLWWCGDSRLQSRQPATVQRKQHIYMNVLYDIFYHKADAYRRFGQGRI